MRRLKVRSCDFGSESCCQHAACRHHPHNAPKGDGPAPELLKIPEEMAKVDVCHPVGGSPRNDAVSITEEPIASVGSPAGSKPPHIAGWSHPASHTP